MAVLRHHEGLDGAVLPKWADLSLLLGGAQEGDAVQLGALADRAASKRSDKRLDRVGVACGAIVTQHRDAGGGGFLVDQVIEAFAVQPGQADGADNGKGRVRWMTPPRSVFDLWLMIKRPEV